MKEIFNFNLLRNLIYKRKKHCLFTFFISFFLLITACSNLSTNSLKNESEQYLKYIENVRIINARYYIKSGEIVKDKNSDGRAFTDHKTGHVEMVKDKSLETRVAVINLIRAGNLIKFYDEKGIPFSDFIDIKTLVGAALSHDTGMCGGGYALEPLLDKNGKQQKDEFGRKMFKKDSSGIYLVHKEVDSNFGEIRDNHSLNSAINMLINRNLYLAAGYTDSEIDKMAAVCMAHSKSGSGVSNLNRRSDWKDSFDRLCSVIKFHNDNNPDAKIKFDRTVIENDDQFFSSMITEAFVVRIGDVSRDSGPDAEAQSGEKVHVDRNSLKDKAGTVTLELENSVIKIGEDGDEVLTEKSRQVHVGEQNIIQNHARVSGDGKFVHEIIVNDGNSAPACTQEAINDHIEEFACIPDYNFEIRILFIKDCDDFAKESFNNFKIKEESKISNIKVIYPWN